MNISTVYGNRPFRRNILREVREGRYPLVVKKTPGGKRAGFDLCAQRSEKSVVWLKHFNLQRDAIEAGEEIAGKTPSVLRKAA